MTVASVVHSCNYRGLTYKLTPRFHRSRDEKRVCNKKMKELLGVGLKFPTFREGLEAIHQGDTTPFS